MLSSVKRGVMKKYIVIGLLAGVAVSALVVFMRRRYLMGTEFEGIFDASTVADDLFGDAFEELPDRP
jgi:hypothetical protein